MQNKTKEHIKQNGKQNRVTNFADVNAFAKSQNSIPLNGNLKNFTHYTQIKRHDAFILIN